MNKRPYGNFFIEDKLNALKFSTFCNNKCFDVESLLSYKLLIKPILYLYNNIRFKLTEKSYKANEFGFSILLTIVLIGIFLLPIIVIELAIHTLYLLLAIFVDLLFFDDGSFSTRYLDLEDYLNYISTNIFFQIIYWVFKFKSASMPNFIKYFLLFIIYVFLLVISLGSFSSLVTGNSNNFERYNIILRDLYIICSWRNYYYSNKVTKTLIQSYDHIIKLIRENEKYFDKLFSLFEENFNLNDGIEDNFELINLRLMNYAKDDNAFNTFKDSLMLKTEIICNLDNSEKLDKIIQKIGISETREYLNDLQEYIKKFLEEYRNLYNDSFMKLRIKLL